MEASHRPKQAQHFSTCRKVQNGNPRVHQDLPDSRVMGIVDRFVGRLPTHPHPSKLKEIPKALLQVSGVPVHLPPIRTSHSPPGLYNDCKRSDQNFTKGLWSDRKKKKKKLHINVLELKAVSLALRDFKDQCQNQTVLVGTDNSTVVAYINKQGTQQKCVLYCGRS